jgi:hypothetical protein
MLRGECIAMKLLLQSAFLIGAVYAGYWVGYHHGEIDALNWARKVAASGERSSASLAATTMN